MSTYIPMYNFTNNSSWDAAQKHYNLETSPHYPTLPIILAIITFFAVRKHGLIETKLPLCLLYIFLSLFILPIILSIILVFGFVRQVVRLILHLKFWNDFGGLLNGSDTIWALEDTSKSIINALVVVKSENDPIEFIASVRKLLEEKCFNTKAEFEKLSCVRDSYLGYNFLIRNQYRIEDCLRVIQRDSNELISKSELEKIVSNFSNKDMPKNNSALWEVLLFEQGIAWDNQKGHFAIVFRIHHSLADGFSLLSFLLKHFSDNPNRHDIDSAILKPPKSRWDIVKKWYNNLCALILGPAIILIESSLRPMDNNILHDNKALSGDKLLTWSVEKEKQLVQIVKNIKNSVLETRFSDVVLTAVSASFREYYHKKNLGDIPEFVTAVIPAIIDTSPGGFVNNFSVGMLNLPISCKGTRNFERLNQVKTQSTILRTSPDYVVNYWLLTVISAVLPEKILRPLLHSAHCTMVISNLPGTKKLTVLDGLAVEDIVFWIPHRGTTGLGVSILTYDDRFQFGLMVDETLISNREDATDILNGITKHILKLYKKLKSVN